MTVPSNDYLNNIDTKSYYVDFKDESVGFTKAGSLKVRLNGKVLTAKVDQLSAEVAKAKFKGFSVEVDMVLMRTDPEMIAAKALEGAFGFRGGTTQDTYGIGDNPQDVSTSMAGELVLVPTDNASGVRTDSFLFHKAYVDTTAGIEFVGSQDEFQEFAVKFICLPDLNQDAAFRYGVWGDVDNTSATAPIGMCITVGNEILEPVLTMTALDLNGGQKLQLKAVGIWGTVSTTNTAAINDGDDITASDTTIAYDTLVGSFQAGDYIKIGSEYIYLGAVSATQFTGCVRGCFGSTAAIHADDAVITKVENLRFNNVTQSATWASSSTGDVTVGNVAGVNGNTQKGKLVWVADGSSNIKATLTAVDSPNLVVTCNAM